MKKQKASSESERSGSTPPVIAKSCDEKLGDDPIQSSSQQYQTFPRPKSYQSAQEDSNWQDLTSAEKIQYKQQISKGLGIEKPIRKQKKKAMKFQQKPIQTGKYFTDEIVDSQQVSMADSTPQHTFHNGNSMREQIDKIKQHNSNKKSYFNLMLLGAASTGKTTYMQCFLKQYKHKSNDKIIKQHTQKITQVKSQTMFSNLSLDFYIIDTPGYTHSTINEYSQSIQFEIKSRIDNYRKQCKNAMTQSSVYEKQERQIRDERIHCCLFFFRGPRLHSDDWRLMEELHDKCNIIPVIAKGDCYTTDEISELKKYILSKAKERHINWFNVEQYIRQKYPDQLHLIEKGPYGISPPFMVACSTTQIEQNNQIKIARQFKWGTCYIEDEKHTQFSILNKLMIRYLRQGFVKMTDVKQDTYKQKIDKSKGGLQIIKKGIGYCIILTVIGAVIYKVRPEINTVKN